MLRKILCSSTPLFCGSGSPFIGLGCLGYKKRSHVSKVRIKGHDQAVFTRLLPRKRGKILTPHLELRATHEEVSGSLFISEIISKYIADWAFNLGFKRYSNWALP